MSTPRRSPAESSRRTKASSSDTSAKTHNQSDAQTNRFQGLFTEEDEVNLLKCYLKITRSANPTKNSQPTLDSPGLDRIESSLGLKFSQTHIVDKLHRLKLKYYKLARTKSLRKTSYDRQIHEIGRSIWGKALSPRRHTEILRITDSCSKKESSETPVGGKGGGVDLNNFPLLVNEFSLRFSGNLVWREGLRAMEERSLMGMNEKWVLLHIEEAELKARRAALVQQQLRITDFRNGQLQCQLRI